MAAPQNFVAHLAQHQYHPRSNKHGIALCDYVLEDLLANCPKIAADAAARKLVYERNRVIVVGSNDWNIDLILGPPPSHFQPPPTSDPIVRAVPATIRIAIEAKTIMTEHGKARRNRQRDLDSFHQFARRYDASTVTAALTVVNIATTFKSPLRQVVTVHKNIQALAQGTIAILRSIQLRASVDQPGLDANTVILVEHDNVNSTKTALVTGAPAPLTGDPLQYDSFLHRTCAAIRSVGFSRPLKAALSVMAKSRRKASSPKSIVYLWGAGATQAEITYLGASTVNLLMRDSEQLGEGVATRILRRLPQRWQSAFAADNGTDIEKLISLLAASGVATHAKLADTIRELYFDDICGSLAAARILTNPQLAVGLLAMHSVETFRKNTEMLAGIITTNHDGLLQSAAQTIEKEVDIGIPFQSTDITQAATSRVRILQLHGSFTWRFALPTSVSLLTASSTYSPDTVWIPPAILKESKTYPFNKLAALAYELLSKYCDVLRIVGSALTQNDWHILSLIFNAQRHREITKGSAFRIELITSHRTGTAISS
jgi:hypothetical protein